MLSPSWLVVPIATNTNANSFEELLNSNMPQMFSCRKSLLICGIWRVQWLANFRGQQSEATCPVSHGLRNLVEENGAWRRQATINELLQLIWDQQRETNRFDGHHSTWSILRLQLSISQVVTNVSKCVSLRVNRGETSGTTQVSLFLLRRRHK